MGNNKLSLSVLKVSDERIQAHRNHLNNAINFRTPKRLPLTFFYCERNEGNLDHLTPQEVINRDYIEYSNNPDFMYHRGHYNKVIDEWNNLAEKFPTLDINAFYLMKSFQECMATAFGVPFEIDDEGNLTVDYIDSRVMNTLDDWENPKLNKHPDYTKDGMFGHMWSYYNFLNDYGDPRIHYRFPIYLGPFLIAGHLLGTEASFMGFEEEPEKMKIFMNWLTDECIKMKITLQKLMGEKKVHGHFQYDRGTAMLWDDNISMCSDKWYVKHISHYNERIFKVFGGGGFHTCGPLKPKIYKSLYAMPSMHCINFAFVNSDMTLSADDILEMKELLHGAAMINCPPPNDLDSFTPEFVKKLMKNGGVSIYDYGDDERCERLTNVLDKSELL